MRTITLEIVRHGPANNQLLSPLTQYLALCENHPAVTLQLPLEHAQMLYRLNALAYKMGKASREFQLRDTAQMLGELLAQIPGLTADMNRRDVVSQEQDGSGDGENITHLRLVLSASELALLPFELALAPIGFPGAGQPLLLQSQRPIGITRETRRVAEEHVVWPELTRVLFAVASPAGLARPPAAAHLLALRRALEPWVGTRTGALASDQPEKDDRLSRHLTVLTDVSLEALESACAEGGYTHVHILAHGGEFTEGYDTRFGLMFQDSADPMGDADCVSGERLATALRASRKGRSGQLAGPAVVTLASCHSGAVGSVIGIGASIAHALHADGIPMVIASQFPLSFGGSVRMVEILYEGLLAGEDPRRLLIDLRRTLHTQFPETHDWASVAAYSSLPGNFDRQLAHVQIQRARRRIDVALDLADEVVARVDRARRSRSASANSSAPATTLAPVSQIEIAAAMQRVRESRSGLARLAGRLPSQRARIAALLASADKREAALEYETIKRESHVSPRAALEKRVWPLLERARSLYDDAFTLDPASHWAVVQYISLTVVLRHGAWPSRDLDPVSGAIEKLWSLAEVQSLRDLSSNDYARRTWALGNLIELYLLAPLIDEVIEQYSSEKPAPNWRDRACNYATELAKVAQPGAFEIFSTRRQIVRYLDLYFELGPTMEAAVGIAEQVANLLPDTIPEDISRG